MVEAESRDNLFFSLRCIFCHPAEPALLAQFVEHQTYKWEVWGSTPSGVGRRKGSSIGLCGCRCY